MAERKWTPNFDVVEEFGTRRENWKLETPMAQVTIRCKMEERWLVMVDIVGNFRDYPYNVDIPVPLRAVDASIRFDKACKNPDTSGQSYEEGYDALIDITYSVLIGEFYTQTDTEEWPQSLYVEEDMQPNMEFLTDDFNKYGWSQETVDDPVPVPISPQYRTWDKSLKPNEEPGRPEYKTTLSRTVRGYKVLPKAYKDVSSGGNPAVAPVDIDKWAGSVHTKDYTSDITGILYPAGTLLLTNPKLHLGANILRYESIDPDVIPFGLSWRLSADLIYQENGWQTFYRSVCGEEDGEKVDKSGYYYILFKGCNDAQQTQYHPIHEPYKELDMRSFIFDSSEFPPVPWPPTAP